MFTKLETPDTPEYSDFKKLVLSANFGWSYNSMATGYSKYVAGNGYSDLAFYSHSFLHGPSPSHGLYSKVNSEHIDLVEVLLDQIFSLNNLKVEVVYRINANAVHPVESNILTVPHNDHEFPHKNMLIYLTDAGGSTFVEGEEFAPEEDDVIIFEGLHWHQLPKHKRRVVLVMTYI